MEAAMKAGRILVVDDEESTRTTLHDYFTEIGYNVVTADDGEDALKKFVPGAFDCVISDLFMPEIDGIELLKRIRVEDSDVFFLMITGFPGLDSAINAMKEGAYDYITKPFHMDDMRLKVERALHVKKTEASLKRVKGLFLSFIILIPVLVSLGILFGIFWKDR
jgi:two-component system, NtrC family, response regulator PilR